MKDWHYWLMFSAFVVLGFAIITNDIGLTIEILEICLGVGGIILLIRRLIVRGKRKLEEKRQAV